MRNDAAGQARIRLGVQHVLQFAAPESLSASSFRTAGSTARGDVLRLFPSLRSSISFDKRRYVQFTNSTHVTSDGSVPAALSSVSYRMCQSSWHLKVSVKITRVSDAPRTATDDIERYLLTGTSDPLSAAWPGNIVERGIRAHHELRGALVRAVRQRETKHKCELRRCSDPVGLTRSKVKPMVHGLFPRDERRVVLSMLERSVVFLTRENIETILLQESFDGSAWTLANLYLTGIGAELLSEDAPGLEGFSQDTTCYVSPQYFREDHPFADFIVHEAAHVFHNCRRSTLGLKETRSKVWLLDIEYRKRETFAYSCEAYSRILKLGKRPADRQALADEFGRTVSIADECAENDEVARVVRSASAARNGWAGDPCRM
jgi:hypothetical protein